MRASRASLRNTLGFVAFVLLLAGSLPAWAQMVDLNGNGMSDIWEIMFNASGLDPNGDADGDGASNRMESIAGTNPFDSNSVPKITATAIVGTNFNVTMPCALGKQYILQSAQPGWSNWTTEASVIVRSGSTVTLSAPATVSAKFFRIAISDVDTDGDGVNDWEEYQLGLDPLNPYSNGQLDLLGQPLNDYAYVVGKLPMQNVVTISATHPTANQPDPGQNAVNLGMFTVSRGGFPLNSIRVNLALGAAGPGTATESVDFLPLQRVASLSVGNSSQSILLTPLANTNRLAPAVATLTILPGTGYTVGSASNASIVIYPSATAAGIGLTGQYYTNSSTTYSNSANFNPSQLVMTRVDSTIDFTWGTGTLPFTNSGYYTVRWTGQVQPQYSETYYFDANTDDGVRLWVNNQLVIDRWVLQGATDSIGTIALQAGVRYNIQMDYFNGGGNAAAHLSWYSASQPKQVIPSSRFYPGSFTPAPPAVISPLTAVAFLGQPFTYTVMGANGASPFTAGPLPPGLNFNQSTGLISGIPNLAGDYQVTLTVSNAIGVGGSVVDIQVIDTGSAVTREVWLGVPGTNVADIPVNTPATLTNSLGTLEGITDFGDNYGERIRGYLTAPVTGNYYFWIAGSDSAELWISNDSEPANKVRRATVSGSASQQWNLQANQRSGWLTLVAGQRYYLEVLHKAGVGSGDNWSVGWLQDPTGTNSNVSGVVPGYVLSRYFSAPAYSVPGTLYVATMVAASGVLGMPVGTATLRLSADNSHAVLNFDFSDISSPVIGEHINNDPYLTSPSQTMYDISAAHPLPDGSYNWPITPVGTLSSADVLEILNEGKGYITILTVNYPNGELIGHFARAEGSSTFTPPAPAPTWTDDSSDPNAAARFLIQSTFGPSPSDITSVQSLGYAGWLSNQFALPATHHLPLLLTNVSADPTAPPYPGTLVFNTWWQQSLTAPDQLRQRVAFALSEIMVVSDQGALQDNGQTLSAYYDTLLDNAFGNYRDLLKAVTLTPAMGNYLNMRGNSLGSIITGIHANENYAREIMQLFSVGLNRMWPDGTLVMNSQGNLVPTYNQNVIMGFAAVFTGWNYYQTNQANGRLPTNFNPPTDNIDPMVLVPSHHDLGTKLLLDNVMLPQAWGSQANSSSTNFDIYCSQDLELALNSIFNNQNVGPYICRELIQRLVTSSPSPDYLYRVVQVFNDNGAGVRGDLQAVISAILLDYEARSPVAASQVTFGKQREPLLKVSALARAFPPPAPVVGTYIETTNQTIIITNPVPHRLTNSDTVFLTYTDTSSLPAPPAQPYGVTVRSPTSFSVSAPGISAGTYGQTNGVLTVNLGSHGLTTNNSAYLSFVTGGASNGVYQVVGVPDSSHFLIATTDTNTLFGGVLMPKFSGGGYIQSRTNLTMSLTLPHGLNSGDWVFIHFTAAGSPTNGVYQVQAVPDAKHFTIITGNSANTTQNGQIIYPLIPPALNRFGTVQMSFNTWQVGFTDTGSSAALGQTPLNSPTVFNFFFPSYKFQGPLATAGLTTPEFQLTSDTTVAWQMNFLEGALLNSSLNTNGLTSFIGGNGTIVLDLGPWMTPAYTSSAGVPNLVDALSTQLMGGPLSSPARTTVINFVSNLPFSTPPTCGQMRDRVRSVVHLMVCSPDYTIQR